MAVLGTFNHLLSLKSYVVLGLLLCSLFYMVFPITYWLSSTFSIALVFVGMCLNGFFQATARPGCIAIMGNWFHKQKKSLVMGLWAMNANMGNILALLFCNILERHSFSWILNFGLTASIALLMVIIDFFLLKERPSHDEALQESLISAQDVEVHRQEQQQQQIEQHPNE